MGTADRLSGAVLLGFAVLLYFVIVPWQVETVGYGWLRPRTLPRIVAVGLALAGAWLMLRPGAGTGAATPNWGRAALFAAVLVASLALMARVGFEIAAPAMALAVMGLAGERRPLWLLLGAVVAPAAIWLVVAVALGRPLP